jgi:hypothetical protein
MVRDFLYPFAGKQLGNRAKDLQYSLPFPKSNNTVHQYSASPPYSPNILNFSAPEKSLVNAAFKRWGVDGFREVISTCVLISINTYHVYSARKILYK